MPLTAGAAWASEAPASGVRSSASRREGRQEEDIHGQVLRGIPATTRARVSSPLCLFIFMYTISDLSVKWWTAWVSEWVIECVELYSVLLLRTPVVLDALVSREQVRFLVDTWNSLYCSGIFVEQSFNTNLIYPLVTIVQYNSIIIGTPSFDVMFAAVSMGLLLQLPLLYQMW